MNASTLTSHLRPSPRLQQLCLHAVLALGLLLQTVAWAAMPVSNVVGPAEQSAPLVDSAEALASDQMPCPSHHQRLSASSHHADSALNSEPGAPHCQDCWCTAFCSGVVPADRPHQARSAPMQRQASPAVPARQPAHLRNPFRPPIHT